MPEGFNRMQERQGEREVNELVPDRRITLLYGIQARRAAQLCILRCCFRLGESAQALLVHFRADRGH